MNTQEQTQAQAMMLVTDVKEYNITDIKLNPARLERITAVMNKNNSHWYFEKQGQIPMPQYRMIESPVSKLWHKVKTVNQLALKQNTLHLGTHTRCICDETGIAFAVALPSPITETMQVLHPFAFYSNVIQFIKSYQHNGLSFAKLEPQVLAGMLITILTEKKLTACHDVVKANLRLQQAETKVLIQAIGYFVNLQSTQHFPSINLIENDSRATESILSYMAICQGRDDTVKALHAHEKKTGKISAKRWCPACETTDCACSNENKVKVPQTEQAAQEAVLKQDNRSMNKILERLEKEHTTVSSKTFKLFRSQFQKVGLMTDKGKNLLIENLYDVFGEDDTTKALAFIIKTVNTDEIQKDLLTFTQEIETAQQEWQQAQEQKAIDNPQDPTGLRALMGK